jgi:predicted metalloprotease with PDZ domain
VLIRRLSGGKKSLDDFCQVFHTGGPARMPALKPDTFEDVVAALNQVQPYNWAEFLTTRIKKVAPDAPLEGISGGGWKLTYGEERSAMWKAGEEYDENADFTHSIGISVKKDGTIQDVRVTSKAFAAGVPPATKLIAVNGRQYTVEVMQDALNGAKGSAEPIELLVKNGEFYKTHRVDYHDGQQYPRLERVAGKPDVLAEILRSKAR